MSESASLKIGEQTYELPIITGTEGEKAIDISKLRDSSGILRLIPVTKTRVQLKVPLHFWMGKKVY